MQRNIVLISNDKKIEEFLTPKLLLLREVDGVVSTNYLNAEFDISRYYPEIVILYCSYEQEECLDLIKKIKNTSVILLMESYDKDFLLSAYDAGIYDYLTTSATDADILIRVLWALKSKEKVDKYDTANYLLDAFNIKDNSSGIYLDYKPAFEYEIEKILKTNSEATFVALAINEEVMQKVSDEVFLKSIKSSLRDSDLVAKVSNNKYYLLLNKTNSKGAFTIFERIKSKVGYDVSAGFSSIKNQSFEELERETVKALNEALMTNKEVIVVNHDYSAENWIDEINVGTNKNFKLFKQAFIKKLEHVIAPVFYRMQQNFSKNLPDTKFEQNIDEKLSVFIIKLQDVKNVFKITYPGFSKINIDIIYEGLDSPENKRIVLDINELNEEVLETFLNEFYEATKKTKMLYEKVN